MAKEKEVVILYIENDLYLLNSFAEFIRDEGIPTFTADTIEAAKKTLKNESISLILVGINFALDSTLSDIDTPHGLSSYIEFLQESDKPKVILTPYIDDGDETMLEILQQRLGEISSVVASVNQNESPQSKLDKLLDIIAKYEQQHLLGIIYAIVAKVAAYSLLL